MARAALTSHAPVLLVKDVVAAAAYYRDKVGFDEQKLYGSPTNFAIIERDGCRLMLAQVSAETRVVPHWQIVDKLWSAYFWVDDAAALYAEYQSSGAIIDYTLSTTAWGTREFGIQDLDGHDIGFGQRLNNS